MFTGPRRICHIVIQIKLDIVRCFQPNKKKIKFTYQFKVPSDKKVFIHLSDDEVSLMYSVILSGVITIS